MTARPATVPTLDTNQTNRTIPAPSKVTDGYVLNDILPSDAANYLWGWTGDWLSWLNERTADGVTAARDLYLQGVDAAVASGLDGGDVRFTTGAGDGAGVDGTFSWYVGASERAQLGGTGMNVADGLVVGALSGTIAPVADRIHVYKGSSGGTGAYDANGLLVLEHSSACYIQFMSPSTSQQGILFGDDTGAAADVNVGAIFYDHNLDLMYFKAADTVEVNITSAGVNVLDGLVVGADSAAITPVANRIVCGNANFYLDWNLTDPFLYFDANDYIQYDRSASTHGNWLFYIDSSLELVLRTEGLAVGKGLVVGSTAIAPVADAIIIGTANFKISWDGTDPFLYFDANDYIQYDRSASTHGNWLFYIDSSLELVLRTEGLAVGKGLVVGSTAIAPVADAIIIGTANFKISWDGTDPAIQFDANDYITYDVSTNILGFTINSNLEMYLNTAGLYLASGYQINVLSGSITSQGAAGLRGLLATGGSSSADGVRGIGGATNGNGVTGQGTGSGSGIDGTGGGTSGIGVEGTGGTGNGIGVKGTGIGSGVGVNGIAANGIGVSAQSTNGVALYGLSATNYGASLVGNSTKSPLHLAPLSSVPSSPSNGDIFYDNNLHKLRVYANGGWETVTSA